MKKWKKGVPHPKTNIKTRKTAHEATKKITIKPEKMS